MKRVEQPRVGGIEDAIIDSQGGLRLQIDISLVRCLAIGRIASLVVDSVIRLDLRYSAFSRSSDNYFCDRCISGRWISGSNDF